MKSWKWKSTMPGWRACSSMSSTSRRSAQGHVLPGGLLARGRVTPRRLRRHGEERSDEATAGVDPAQMAHDLPSTQSHLSRLRGEADLRAPLREASRVRGSSQSSDSRKRPLTRIPSLRSESDPPRKRGEVKSRHYGAPIPAGIPPTSSLALSGPSPESERPRSFRSAVLCSGIDPYSA